MPHGTKHNMLHLLSALCIARDLHTIVPGVTGYFGTGRMGTIPIYPGPGGRIFGTIPINPDSSGRIFGNHQDISEPTRRSLAHMNF